MTLPETKTRELKNAVERGGVLSGNTINADDLPDRLQNPGAHARPVVIRA